MPAKRWSRRYGIVAASVAVHAALLAAVAVQAPRLRMPAPELGPPEAVIPVLILPRTPPATAAPGAKPTPIRLHRRVQRFANEPLPVEPLVAPTKAGEEAAARPAPSSGPRPVTGPSPEDAFAANARNALRSRLNCDDANLSRAEREGCLERFGAASRSAPVLGLGIEGDKASDLARAALRKEQDYGYKRGILPPSPPTPGAGWDKYRGPVGQAEALGGALGNDRPTAKVPF